MKKCFETLGKAVMSNQHLQVGGLTVSIAVLFALTVSSQAFSHLALGVRHTHSLLVWYVESGQWQIDANTYKMHFEHVFNPESGSGTWVEIDDEEDE